MVLINLSKIAPKSKIPSPRLLNLKTNNSPVQIMINVLINQMTSSHRIFSRTNSHLSKKKTSNYYFHHRTAQATIQSKVTFFNKTKILESKIYAKYFFQTLNTTNMNYKS